MNSAMYLSKSLFFHHILDNFKSILLYIKAIIVMITITRIKDLMTQNMKTRKNHQIYKSTLIKDRIHLLCQFNFSLILNTTFFLMIYFMKVLRCCPSSSPPQIRFGSSYERVVSRDRVYGH